MSVITGTKEARIAAIAERLRERSDELSSMGYRIEETNPTGSSALLEASQHLDDAAYILEELKLA